jgi:hypothetical protein
VISGGIFTTVIRERVYRAVKVPDVIGLASGARKHAGLWHDATRDEIIERIRRHADIGSGDLALKQADW